MIEEAGRSQFGAVLYRTTELFLRLFGLSSLDELPEIGAFDPSPELEEELRERLLRAGEARAAQPRRLDPRRELAAGGVDSRPRVRRHGGARARGARARP